MEFTSFETAIKDYLDKHAQEDPTFAPIYAKPNKSIAECCKYITQEVEKNCRKGGRCVAVREQEVYGLAIHYYDEDDIVVDGPKKNVQVAAGATETVSETVKATAEAAETKHKARKSKKSKTEIDPNIPEPLEIPIF